MDVEAHEDPLQFPLVFLLDHDLALVSHDLVCAGGVGDSPCDPDGASILLRLVGILTNVAESDLASGAGLTGTNESLVMIVKLDIM